MSVARRNLRCRCVVRHPRSAPRPRSTRGGRHIGAASVWSGEPLGGLPSVLRPSVSLLDGRDSRRRARSAQHRGVTAGDLDRRHRDRGHGVDVLAGERAARLGDRRGDGDRAWFGSAEHGGTRDRRSRRDRDLPLALRLRQGAAPLRSARARSLRCALPRRGTDSDRWQRSDRGGRGARLGDNALPPGLDGAPGYLDPRAVRSRRLRLHRSERRADGDEPARPRCLSSSGLALLDRELHVLARALRRLPPSGACESAPPIVAPPGLRGDRSARRARARLRSPSHKH